MRFLRLVRLMILVRSDRLMSDELMMTDRQDKISKVGE